MGWLSHDDQVYCLILVASFLISSLVRTGHLPAWVAKNGGLVGFGMAVLIIGWKVLYSVPLAFGTAVVIRLTAETKQKQMPMLIFISSFTYLIVCRCLHFILPINELASHANAVVLLMTLRVIGFAYDVFDSREHRFLRSDDPKKARRVIEEPQSVIEILNFFYHYCGLFTGPYYSYQMLEDSYVIVHLQGWSPSQEITKRFLTLAWSVPAFAILNAYFPLDGLRTDAVWDWSLVYRFFYAAAIFTVFRFRVYSAWAAAESVCLMVGIGMYPTASKAELITGPKDLAVFKELHGNADSPTSYDSEAMVNIDMKEVEFSETFKYGIHGWNRSVQKWLALYVYQRLHNYKAQRTSITMFVSALWHGTYAGYFMSFLLVPCCLAVEEMIRKRTDSIPNFKYLYIPTLRSRGFDFLAAGFLLKNFHDTVRFWGSLYFWLPLVLLGLFFALRATSKPNAGSRAVPTKRE
ncbi:unnamed protein product, partial [Mesorhabditis spiculigera]